MQKFKDNEGGVHDPEMVKGGKLFLETKRPHLMPFTEINQAEFDTLTAPVPLTAQEISDNKDAQVNVELGGDNLRILVSVFKEIITDGTITSKTPDEIIAQAKTKRRAELP